MLIGQLAERSGVPAKTIRYYESIEVLPAAERSANGYRRYPDAILHRLAFIRAAQASGFTLGEIRGIVAFRDRGAVPCDHVRQLIDRRAVDVEQRIAELQAIRTELARLARRARHLDPTECQPAAVCHIIGPPAPRELGLPDTRLGRRLRRHRRAVIDLAARRGAHHVRVFGSVARGDDGDDSDVDLFVDLDDDVGLVSLAGLERELSALLGAPVDVIPVDSFEPGIRDVALAEAITL